MPTGIETSTLFLHSCNTFTRFCSMPKTSATRRSWSRAMSNGFSRRCETGARVDTDVSFLQGVCGAILLLDGEADELPAGGAGKARDRGDADAVLPLAERVAGRAAPGQSEGVLAGEQVAEADERAELRSVGAHEVELQQRDGLNLVVPRPAED